MALQPRAFARGLIADALYAQPRSPGVPSPVVQQFLRIERNAESAS